MSYTVELSDNFKREAKRLMKKYASLERELMDLVEKLENNPMMGKPMGKGVYKIRLAIISKGKGKSGGARVMTLVQIEESTVTIFSIYDKGEKDSISDKEIKDLLKTL